MNVFLTLLGLLFMFLGLAGSILPILPGPPLSWVGLLLLHLTDAVPNNTSFLSITFIVAVLIFVLDYLIPAIGTKRFGGSKAGMIGSTIGVFVGFLSPIPGGIIMGSFFGALLGELSNKTDTNTALKAAFGSFIGFITGAFLKFIIAIVYFGFFMAIFWEYKSLIL